MEELVPFFLVLFAGLFFSEVLHRLHLPWVVTLLLAGIFIGPHGLKLFTPDTTINFLSEIGLVFLMFMAGLETKLSTFKELKDSVSKLAFFNSIIPALAGVLIAVLFGYDLSVAALLGIIFMSSSVAVIVPSLKSLELLGTRVGRAIIGATILEDILSLVLLSVFIQSSDPITTLPLPVFYGLLAISLYVMRWIIKKTRILFTALNKNDKTKDLFQDELRSVLVILIGTVVIFELLGLHPIIAGFFAGLVMADSVTSQTLKSKLRAISYGLFIPIFFVVVGSKTNIGIFFEVGQVYWLVGAIIVGSLVSKFASGFLGAKLSGFSKRQSLLIGSATIPQLSTTLAVVFAGFELGILDEPIVTAMVVLSMVTTFISPILMRFFSDKVVKSKTKQPLIETV